MVRSFEIPTVLSAEELKNKGFHRVVKISVNGVNALDKNKKTTLAKITALGDIIENVLSNCVDKFPRIDKKEDFFPELIDLIIGIDKYKKSLGAIRWAEKKIEKLKIEAIRNVRRSKDIKIIESTRKGFYGRLSSVINQISDELIFLQSCRSKFKFIPSIDPKIATAVVAGFPNVGKSILVSKLSTATPVVAPYPFTTKDIIVGHISDEWRKFQIIDTPGLFDRDSNDRNNIERRAILALKYLTHVILFILDPSETCGYSIERQNALLESVKKGFKGIPIIVAESKNDIMISKSGNINFSAKSGDNIDQLRKKLISELRKVEPNEEE
ncbi:MAG: 50S ribosome-binding GTPase [archaeon]|nr:50S ribosome-binding GTPase [archaeon]